jgi:hypothetical protein
MVSRLLELLILTPIEATPSKFNLSDMKVVRTFRECSTAMDNFCSLDNSQMKSQKSLEKTWKNNSK